MTISTADHHRLSHGPWKPLGFQALTPTIATGLTVPAGAKFAYISQRTQPSRWRDDGTSPSATVGIFLAANEVLIYRGDLSAIEFIDTAAGAGNVEIAYYG